MRMFLLALAASAAVGSISGAQEPQVHRMVHASDSLMIRKNTYRNLMAGIVLAPQQRETAEEVIAAEDRAFWAVPHTFSATFDCPAWERTAHLIARRDSTLLTIMTTAADSAKFSQRAAKDVMPTCPEIVGHP